MKHEVNTWVLLRGLTREHRHWADFPEQLKNIFPKANIICPDLPGNGDNAKLKSPVNIKHMLDFIRRDMAAISQPVHIIGLSMGAMVAVEWMKSYPEECAAAILMNASFKGISPFYDRLNYKNYFRILYTLLSNDIEAKEKQVLRLTSNCSEPQQRIICQWVGYAKANPVTLNNALRQLLAAARYSVPQVKPDQPILLLNGLQDKLVNPRCSLSLARKWTLAIESHGEAGHDLTLDAGTWVCAKIKAWLDGL